MIEMLGDEPKRDYSPEPRLRYAHLPEPNNRRRFAWLLAPEVRVPGVVIDTMTEGPLASLAGRWPNDIFMLLDEEDE